MNDKSISSPKRPWQHLVSSEDVSVPPEPSEEVLALTKAMTDLANLVKDNQSLPVPQPVFNLNMPPINLTTQMPEQGQPTITFSPIIQPSDVIVQPQNTVNVEPTPVNVTNENSITVQPAPVENVVNVQPTPLEIVNKNMVNVEPTPLTVTNENNITVQPADVTVLPAPEPAKDEGTTLDIEIIRDMNGKIKGAKGKKG